MHMDENRAKVQIKRRWRPDGLWIGGSVGHFCASILRMGESGQSLFVPPQHYVVQVMPFILIPLNSPPSCFANTFSTSLNLKNKYETA